MKSYIICQFEQSPHIAYFNYKVISPNILPLLRDTLVKSSDQSKIAH